MSEHYSLYEHRNKDLMSLRAVYSMTKRSGVSQFELVLWLGTTDKNKKL